MVRRLLLGIMALFLLGGSAHAQVFLSGPCFDVEARLDDTGVPVNGKIAYSGTGTVLSNPNVPLEIEWDGARWIMKMFGNTYYEETNDTTIPNNTVIGSWSALPGAPCAMASVTIRGPGTLPVELVYFTGHTRENTIALNWQTSSETNNYGFEIEKSLDGEQWDQIGFIQGGGTTTEVLNYSFIDELPEVGPNYYRLRQVDYTGEFEYSETVNVRYAEEIKDLSIFPNPTKGQITISGNDLVNAELSIFDNFGRLVRTQTSDQERIQMDVSDLVDGAYMIQIKRGKNIKTEKFVKLD